MRLDYPVTIGSPMPQLVFEDLGGEKGAENFPQVFQEIPGPLSIIRI